MRFAAHGLTLRCWPSAGAVVFGRRNLRCFFSTVRSVNPRLFEHYKNNPTKYWNSFYKRHQNKFFKDRHYLEKDWGGYFSDVHIATPIGKVVFEVGCGAGNTVFPLVAAYPNLYIHACDFSSHAIALLKSHMDYSEERINAFVCDVTDDTLCNMIAPASVDVVTLIFMLSAVSPEKMPLVIQNLKRVLKPDGYILIRDYALGDFAQVKLESKSQMITKNFYVRGDGTCSFYFSNDSLTTLFNQAGFSPVDVDIYCKQIENRARNIIMDRRWIRAVFRRINCSTMAA